MLDERRAARGMAVLLVALVAAGFVLPWLPLADPIAVSLDHRLLPPLSPGHPLGTDDLGRDVLSRLLHGMSVTLLVSVGAMVAAFAIALVLGGLAGYFHGTLLDRSINWVINLIMSLPLLLVMAAALSISRPGLTAAYVALSLLMWVAPARIIRAEVARRRQAGYVWAATAAGLTQWQIVRRKLLPRAARPALALSYSYLPDVIGLEAGLSLIGLGVQPPSPAIGKMIFDGLPYLSVAWWLAIAPAAALSAILLLINMTAQKRQGRMPWLQPEA